MESAKAAKKTNSKKGKSLVKLINKSDSDGENSEHELSYYVNDRVKLIKEVLKIIKPKKIKSMAPSWMKNMDIGEINSMLLEELLGISNKRLKCIFNGKKLEEDSSSTDPEEEQKPVDIISLDDVSDDDFVIDLDSDCSKGHSKHCKRKIKQEPKKKKIKKEKHDKTDKNKSKTSEKEKTDEENLMSVLELLELQARARAIRSQLALENKKKTQAKENSDAEKDDAENDAIIIESPKNIEIVITSSDSENENSEKYNSKNTTTDKADSSNSNKENQSKMQQDVNENESIMKDSSSNGSNSPITQQRETEKNINNEGGNVKENLQTEHHTSENIDTGSNLEKQHENTNECIRQPEDLQVEITEQSSSGEKIIQSENSTEIIIVNKKDKKNRRRQLRTSVENSSDSESEELTVNKKQQKPKYKKNKTNSTCASSKQQSNIESGAEINEEPKNTELNYKNTSIDEGDGIIINVDQSEIECIISD